MKILITGTAGFIGFNTAKYLLEKGEDIVGIDNFNNYYSVKLKEDRNSILERYGNYKIYRTDLGNKEKVTEVFENEKPDVVINLAAQAGVRHSLKFPHDYIKSNISGFLNILEGCRYFNVKRLVYASSSSVYGGNKKLPFSEADRVDNPISLYAASKKANELMAHSYTHLYGFESIGLRFFTVYGPWGRPDMAMWLFTDAILKNKPISVFNNGNMRRDFTYIDDIVNGVVNSVYKDGLDKYEIFNLGNHRSEDLMEVIGIIEEVLCKKAEKKFLPMQPGDVKDTFADIERARKKLDYEPKTTIKDGIPNFVNWYMNYFDIDR